TASGSGAPTIRPAWRAFISSAALRYAPSASVDMTVGVKLVIGLMLIPAFPPTPLDLLSEETVAPCPPEGEIWKKSPDPLFPETPALIDVIPGKLTVAPPSCEIDSSAITTFFPV